MSSKSWGQWLKVTKKQLRQLGRTIDQELGNVLERHLPSRAGRVANIRVPVRSTPVRFPVRNGGNYRAFHQLTGSLTRGRGFPLAQNVVPRPGVSLFSSGSRFPRSTPRGLFTNWNMSSIRSSGRMYSTASIKFTHEAVSNLSLSLRCFFNSVDGCMPTQNCKHVNANPVVWTQRVGKLSSRDISLIRDMEMFEMINEHRGECLHQGPDQIGCYVEFKMPQISLKNVVPSVTFADPSTLDMLEQEFKDYTAKLRSIDSAVRRICENYGALPMTLEENRLRVHFPNLTVLETEKLIIELGVTLGHVYLDDQLQPKSAENILSSYNSVGDLSTCGLNYSPILSESGSSWGAYQVV